MDTQNLRSRGPLSSFIRYCVKHPDERFWQALRNWSGYSFIFAGHMRQHSHDTFNWEGRRHDEDWFSDSVQHNRGMWGGQLEQAQRTFGQDR